MLRFTVFTPTYNRGYIIDQVYQSLLRQTFHSFEWIVIDDGSTDNTEKVLQRILNDKPYFNITYKKVANGGKHRAINLGLSLAQGELFLCCDSDDYLTDDCLQIADEVEKSIPKENKSQYAGICGLRGYPDGSIIGSTFNGINYLDITTLQRTENGISGDKAEIYYTKIWRKYLFPEFPGENFLTEYVGLSKIASDGYKLRFFNQVVRICEYLPDGLTANSGQKLIENPKGWGLYIGQRIKNGTLIGRNKFNCLLDYYFRCRNRISIFEMADNIHISRLYYLVIVFCGGIIWLSRKMKKGIDRCVI